MSILDQKIDKAKLWWLALSGVMAAVTLAVPASLILDLSDICEDGPGRKSLSRVQARSLSIREIHWAAE
ncbi:MAG: hypothetical protein M3Y50_06790 [Acidobacteriota bacterium]|nr:hypothetical protein [Acidobacteriota bacterium]